ncbi:MAG TPA: thioredoxin family protein [Alphaproteobacteria bacterium]|nr:thioredoxin family protein [Alphaproteobacteria bacterium]
MLVRFLVAVAMLVISAGTLDAADAKRGAAAVNDDGLHVQPWFLVSLLDLRDDLREAQESGKRFAVMWEQRGCIYCRDMHEINFAVAAVSDYVRENFTIVQLNLFGSREVTDFDGQVLPEKELARKWGVVFTPTTFYFPETVAESNKRSGKDLAVAQMPGYLRPLAFLAMFRYVRENRYADTHFQKYVTDHADELRRMIGASAQ